jgi:hypothetical protein
VVQGWAGAAVREVEREARGETENRERETRVEE